MEFINIHCNLYQKQSFAVLYIIYLNCSASQFWRLVAAKGDLVVLDMVELIKSDSNCSDLLIVSMITGRAGLINNECIPCPCRPIQTNVRSADKKAKKASGLGIPQLKLLHMDLCPHWPL
jgi:hypothetical protein